MKQCMFGEYLLADISAAMSYSGKAEKPPVNMDRYHIQKRYFKPKSVIRLPPSCPFLTAFFPSRTLDVAPLRLRLHAVTGQSEESLMIDLG